MARVRDDWGLNRRDVEDVQQNYACLAQEATLPQNHDASESQCEQRCLYDHVQQHRLPCLAEKPEVEEEVLRGASGEKLRMAAVFGRDITKQRPVERNFVLRRVEQLVVGALERQPKLPGDLCPLEPCLRLRQQERLARWGVFAGVKTLLRCDPGDGGARYKFVHQPIIADYPWRHHNHRSDAERRDPQRDFHPFARALRGKDEVDQQKERK